MMPEPYARHCIDAGKKYWNLITSTPDIFSTCAEFAECGTMAVTQLFFASSSQSSLTNPGVKSSFHLGKVLASTRMFKHTPLLLHPVEYFLKHFPVAVNRVG